MRLDRAHIVPLAPPLLCLLCLLFLGAAADRGGKDDELRPWLRRLARLADLYAENALKLSCEEKMSWWDGGDGGGATFNLIFVRHEHTGLGNYRTVPQGEREGREVDPSEYSPPAFVNNVHLWPLIFQAERQAYHRFEIAGTKRVLGRPAIGIRFEPIPPYRGGFNNWFGTAWIDRKAAQFLRFEMQRPEDHARRVALNEYLAGGEWTGPYYFQDVVAEFTVEHNGMRFPGELLLEKAQYAKKWRDESEARRRPISWVKQTYRDCRFVGFPDADQVRAVVRDRP